MKTYSPLIPRGIHAVLLAFVVAFISQSALSSETLGTAEKSDKLPMLGARAEAALKRVERDESLQKITSAPVASDASSNGPIVADDGGTNESDLVKISPAPGTSAKSEKESESGEKPATTNVKPASVSVPAPGKERALDKLGKADKPEKAEGVSAEQSLKWLTNGNSRYVKKHFRSDGRMPADRQRLLAGQKPHAIVLSCSDSRVPPEIVFDQALGEIFVVRVAGESLDSSVIASIEYAVENFGTHLLIVMGHTQCGAVEAALKAKDGESAGSESLDKLLADIRPRLKSVAGQKQSSNLEIESTLNADGAARDLVKRSDILRKKVESGDLVIKPALYRLDSGKVSFY